MSRKSRRIQKETESRWPKIGAVVKAENACREIINSMVEVVIVPREKHDKRRITQNHRQESKKS
jgi:hypothetical protein